MTLLEKAAEKKAEQERRARELTAQHIAGDRARTESWIRSRFHLEDDVELGLERADPKDDRWERGLWRFELEGLEFIAGRFWHGNPGDELYTAVRVGRFAVKASRVEWPPPTGKGQRNVAIQSETYAPRGWRPIRGLADLAR